MGQTFAPANAAELADRIAAADEPFAVVGRDSKRDFGRPVDAGVTLSLASFSGIIDYEPEELIIEAGAATPLAEIESVIAQRNQQFAFEPLNLSSLFCSPGGGSLGGLVACNLSGPRRVKAGAARDHVLGISCVSGRGDILRTGSRVVKNVTGYDLPKLLTGSHGTLAVMTSIVLKVLPRPETQETVVAEGLDDERAIAAMSLALQSTADVSATAHMPGDGTFFRLEGIAASVAYRREALKRLLGGSLAVLGEADSAAHWLSMRDVSAFAGGSDRPLWRLSVVPSEAPATVARITARLECRHVYDWAGGLVWLEVSPTEDAGAAIIRGALASGHATLVRASEELRKAVDVFQPQAPALRALTARVKAAFDPRGLLNPGRMYRGL
jgi:glycolate oxidase FAD binding subunit